MSMVSGVDGNGMSLSGPTCFTIDSGVANSVEDLCGTASGTVVSNLTRGVDSSGYNGSSTLAHAHRVGADVKITDSPYLAQIASLLNGSSSLPNPLTYASSVSTSTIAATSTNLVSVALLNATAFAGAPNGSPTVKGIFEEATQQEVASGTQTGTTGAHLVIPATAASRTASSSPVVVVASGTSQAIDPSFLLNGNYSLGSTTAQSLTSASTTLNGTTILSLVTSTILTTNSSGTVGSIGAATAGTILQYYNGKWNTGIQQTIATSSVSAAANATTNISTSTLPLATGKSIYYFTMSFSNTGGNLGAFNTTTISIANGGNSTTIASFGNSGSTNPKGGVISGIITMNGNTISEVVTGGAICTANCGTTSFVGAFPTYDLSTTTTLNISQTHSGGSATTWVTTTTMEMIQ
jgi:hypothetical protein